MFERTVETNLEYVSISTSSNQCPISEVQILDRRLFMNRI